MIIADTGYWIALANDQDSYHERALSIASQLTEPLITTWPVVTETCYHLLTTCYHLLTRLGNHSQIGFLQNLTVRTFELFDLMPVHGERLTQLMAQYGDLPMDLADASLVVLAESLGHGRILSVDQRDFDIYRWKNKQPFENLMLR